MLSSCHENWSKWLASLSNQNTKTDTRKTNITLTIKHSSPFVMTHTKHMQTCKQCVTAKACAHQHKTTGAKWTCAFSLSDKATSQGVTWITAKYSVLQHTHSDTHTLGKCYSGLKSILHTSNWTHTDTLTRAQEAFSSLSAEAAVHLQQPHLYLFQ